jgi:TetR/AcrR family transcriptional regulator, transcriptional repressor for nem operon
MSHSDNSEGVVAGTRPGKRERLVQAASELVHRQGVEKTTLAEIAEAADVPLGNVYYYYKTKNALLDAVVEAHVQGIEETIASLGTHRTPKGRLKALIRVLADQGEVIAQYGCPHGTLCSELEKSQDDHAVTRLMAIPLAWTEEQFRLMGRRDAHELAIEFLASYQGTAVLTHALREPALLADEGRRLERWIDSLEASR